MNIKETTGYKNSKNKIKKNYDAQNKLSKIISHIEATKDINDLKTNVLSYIYGYEELKNDLSGYHRFGIDKNSKTGKLRLIFSISNNTIYIEYISDNHYEDFKKYLKGK